jgi:hemerythrin-like domain-containing protein
MQPNHANATDARRSALAIIGREHAAYEAALVSLFRQIDLAHAQRALPDPGLFDRRLSELATFIEEFHHPKEDEFLFKAVRERTREADDVLADLQLDHARSPDHLRELKAALASTRHGASAQLEDFALLLERYARAQLDHMRLENRILFPIAERVLAAEDWMAIDAAFRANRAPAI